MFWHAYKGIHVFLCNLPFRSSWKDWCQTHCGAEFGNKTKGDIPNWRHNTIVDGFGTHFLLNFKMANNYEIYEQDYICINYFYSNSHSMVFELKWELA